MASKVLSRKVTIYVNGKEVESTISSLQSAMTKLQHEQKRMTIGSEEYVKASLKIKEIKSVLEAQKIAVRDLGKDWDETRKAAAQYGNILEGLKTATGKVSGIYNWAKGFVEEAAKMDDAYADVMKTTGLTHDEVERLNEAFKQMDTRTSREELNKLASAAGKLGISGVKDVSAFVDAADKINVSWADPESYDYCFEGLPRRSIVAIGSMGANLHGLTRYLWLKGYCEAVERLDPILILRYGDKVPGEDEERSFYVENTMTRRLHSGR